LSAAYGAIVQWGNDAHGQLYCFVPGESKVPPRFRRFYEND